MLISLANPNALLEALYWVREIGPSYEYGLTGDPWYDLGLALLVTTSGLASLTSLGREVAGGPEFQRILRWTGGRGEHGLILVYGALMGAAIAGLVIPGFIALTEVVTDPLLWAEPAHIVPPPTEGQLG